MNQQVVRYLVLCFVLIGIALIPLRVIGYGFLPGDDAMRHAAKVVSEKNWDEILVIREDVKLDSHPGWHAILGAVHKLTNWGPNYLVCFSVIILFILFSLVPILLLNRPEAWPMALLAIVVVNPSIIMRLFLGRPYILTMSIVLALCFLWPELRTKHRPYKTMIILTLLVAASTWIHCSWHLLALPVICFFLAREWRAGILIGVCTVVGILIGASLTGEPYLFLKQTLFHTIRAFENHDLQRMLVTEFQPFRGDALIVMVAFGMLAWRKMRGLWNIKVIDNPVFILALTGWVLGYVSGRFWLDWGIPATCAWIALEFQDALNNKISPLSRSRVLLTVTILGILYIGITNDSGSRWTRNLNIEYLSLEKKEHASWLPDPGGIVYSSDMRIFYQTFFKNPHAPWRYILGFEPTMMPPEDLAIFRKIQWNFGAYKPFEAWVKKMKPEDRLIIRHPPGVTPGIAGLEWRYVATGIWIGRLPRETEQSPTQLDNSDIVE